MSTADNARRVQGFLSATERPRCGNCKHGHEQIAERMPPYDTRTWRCKRGGFTVSAGAICDRHEPQAMAKNSPQVGYDPLKPVQP